MAKKIMVVDDEENLVELVKAVLETDGYEVMPAYSGNECLDKLKKTRPDLILLDILMPGISGRETCEKIRGNPETKDIKIIFLTVVKASEEEGRRSMELGVQDYITKPFDSNDLLKRVKRVLYRSTSGMRYK